jgi:site-specific recombinase XerD
VIDGFIYQSRGEYERGEISKCKWALVRRGGELLKQFHAKATLELPRCAEWETLRNPLRREPTPKEMCDDRNIFTLVRRIKQEMLKFDLKPDTTRDYLHGFDYIIRGHIDNGLTQYSSELTTQLINSARNDYENGNIRRSVFTNVRRIAVFIDEYCETGTITWRTLPKYGQREPQDRFAELLLKFCENANLTSSNSISTIAKDKKSIRRFLFELEDSGIFSFEGVTHRIVSEQVTILSRNYAGGLRRMIHSVRKFLKFLYSDGITKDDLSGAIPMNIAPRRPIHEGFSDDEISRLLSQPDNSTSCGKRNYAIMMLATQTGLRSCDIANLKFQDIDWRNNEIRITQVKTRRALSLYLPAESGNAIADYILNARPECDVSNIFLCECRPFRPIADCSMGNIVKRYLHTAGIERSPNRQLGFHSFRRAFGKRILESEAPLDMLNELLGHFRMNSSKPYVAIDEAGLKRCALSLISATKAGD